MLDTNKASATGSNYAYACFGVSTLRGAPTLNRSSVVLPHCVLNAITNKRHARNKESETDPELSDDSLGWAPAG